MLVMQMLVLADTLELPELADLPEQAADTPELAELLEPAADTTDTTDLPELVGLAELKAGKPAYSAGLGASAAGSQTTKGGVARIAGRFTMADHTATSRKEFASTPQKLNK